MILIFQKRNAYNIFKQNASVVSKSKPESVAWRVLGSRRHVCSQLFANHVSEHDSLVNAAFYFALGHDALRPKRVWTITEITRDNKGRELVSFG